SRSGMILGNPTAPNGDVPVTQGVSLCTFSLSPTGGNYDSQANSGVFNVIASSSTCAWTADSNVPWISITAGGNTIGSGPVSFSISTNTTGISRNGAISVPGQSFTVNQAGNASPTPTPTPTRTPTPTPTPTRTPT